MSYAEEEEEESSAYDQSDRLSYEIKRYYSERNVIDDTSEDDNLNYKNNIKILLQSSIKKPYKEVKELDNKEKSHLFDYEIHNNQVPNV